MNFYTRRSVKKVKQTTVVPSPAQASSAKVASESKRLSPTEQKDFVAKLGVLSDDFERVVHKGPPSASSGMISEAFLGAGEQILTGLNLSGRLVEKLKEAKSTGAKALYRAALVGAAIGVAVCAVAQVVNACLFVAGCLPCGLGLPVLAFFAELLQFPGLWVNMAIDLVAYGKEARERGACLADRDSMKKSLAKIEEFMSDGCVLDPSLAEKVQEIHHQVASQALRYEIPKVDNIFDRISYA